MIQLRIFRAGVVIAESARPAPARDAQSPTGYAGGQRSQILEPGDSYHWVMQTQQMIERGTLRVRTVDYDNAPEGREVHWSGSIRWWLAGVAWIESKLTGEPAAIATERAAVYAGMLLLPLLLIGLVPVIAWRFGPWPASLLSLGLTTVGAFRAEFGVAVFDHHGVACACALMSVVFIAAGGAGWLRGEKREGTFVAWLPTVSTARRWLVASGIAGATGLWISASTTVPVLIGIGVGALLAAWLARTDRGGKTAVRFEPRLWRWWGCAGGGASLAFYALEYFPGPFALRLEVNHPLYALAWLAAGDLLCRISGPKPSADTAPRAGQWIAFALGCVGVAAPLLFIVVLRERVFAVADPVFWMYRDFISEFASALSVLQKHPPDQALSFLLRDVTVLPLLGFPAAVWLAKRGLPPAARSLILLAVCPAVLATLLGLQQVRWLNLSGTLWIAALVVFAQVRLSLLPQSPWRGFEPMALAVLLGAVFLPFPFGIVSTMIRGTAGTGAPSAELARRFVGRDFSHWLRHRVGDDPAFVASAAATATELIYFGGFQGLGTFYWENRAGLRAAVELHAAKTPEAVHAILRRRGITHWVIFSWDDSALMSAGLGGNGAASPIASAGNSYLLDILRSKQPFPAWARPLPYAMPFREQLKADWVLALEIVPPQGPAEAAVRRAQYLAANGQRDRAKALLDEQAQATPAYLPALIQLGYWHELSGNRGETLVAVQRLLPRLGESAELELGDRITLSRLLAVAGHPEAARLQFERCWTDADEPRLRRLMPDELETLLSAPRDPEAGSAPPVDRVELARYLRDQVRPGPPPSVRQP